MNKINIYQLVKIINYFFQLQISKIQAQTLLVNKGQIIRKLTLLTNKSNYR
jgi:hypothetical protein